MNTIRYAGDGFGQECHDRRPRDFRSDHDGVDRRNRTTLGISAYASSGVIGHPSQANADIGHAALDTSPTPQTRSSPCSPTRRTNTAPTFPTP